MRGFVQDVRYALRSFASSRGLTIAAVLSLALGIGANTAIFSVASALLLRPLPYAEPDRLAILWNRSPGLGIAEDWFSTAQYFDIKNYPSSFEALGIAIGGLATLTGSGSEPERLGMIRVSSSMLPLLGARPAYGRLFSPAEDAGAPGTARVVILHHGTWMRRFGGDRSAVGKSVIINGAAHEIVGIMPAHFTLPREVMNTLGGAEEAEVLLPLQLGADAAQRRNGEDYNIMARLEPGVTAAQAQAELDGLTARLREQHPDFYPPRGGLTFSVVPLQDEVVGDVRTPLLILLGAVGVVLLIACANVANLVMSRALSRQKEVAVRSALGATRARIVRQLLTENVVLALCGGAAGLGLAVWSMDAIRALGAGSIPRIGEIRIDWTVLAFGLAVSTLCGLLVGLYPAFRLGGADPQQVLKEGGRNASAGQTLWGRGGLRQLLVAAQLALCVMVLVAAGLLVRSFTRVQQVSPGFDPDGVLTFQLSLGAQKFREPARVYEGYRLLWERLTQIPGVTAAGAVTALPLSQMFAWGPITVEGRAVSPDEKFINVDQRTVAGAYFEAMGIPIVKGRAFTDDDTPQTPHVVIIDQLMADQLWPGQDAIGKRIRTGGFDVRPDTPWMTVIGVTGRVKQYTLDGPEPRIAMYHWHKQRPGRTLQVVVRGSTQDPAALMPSIRAAVRDLDSDLPLYGVKTMDARVGESLAQRRFAVALLSLFAVLAFGLAAVGTYGVIAYLVSQGTREIGIRMALGASPERVSGMVVRSGVRMAALGILAGLGGAFVVTRFMRSVLFGVAPTDPVTFATITGGLLLMSFVSAYVPARRAARIDPVVSLRSE